MLSITWPALVGAVVGVLVSTVVLRRRGGWLPGVLARAALTTAGGAAGAVVGGWWVWTHAGFRLRDLYRWPEPGMQFLSDEQFSVLVVGEWVLWLTAVAVVAGVVGLVARRRAARYHRGGVGA